MSSQSIAAPIDFRNRLFYLYGYPDSPNVSLRVREFESADAQAEELRRRHRTKSELELGLEKAGAKTIVHLSDNDAVDYVVIPDGCSATQRASALSIGAPVISETVVLERIRLPYATEHTANADGADGRVLDGIRQRSAEQAQRPSLAFGPNRLVASQAVKSSRSLSRASVHSLSKGESSATKQQVHSRLRNSLSLDEIIIHERGDSTSNTNTESDEDEETPNNNGRGYDSRKSQPSGAAKTAARAITGKQSGHSTRRAQDRSPVSASDTRSKMTGSEADDSDTNNGENAEELDVFELDDGERRERSEWQEMLTAALMGEVVDSEKKRLNTQPDNYLFNLTDTEYAENLSELLQNRDFRTLFKHIHTELWVGVRAAIRGRTPLQEKQTLESLRAFHTDNAIRAVIDFNADRVVGTTEPGDEGKEHVDFSKECLVQVMKLLRRVDYVEGMYPTLRSLGEAKPVYASRMFQEKLAAITSWTNISERLNLLFTMLQRWTGSSELNLYSTSNPNTYVSTTVGITKDTLIKNELSSGSGSDDQVTESGARGAAPPATPMTTEAAAAAAAEEDSSSTQQPAGGGRGGSSKGGTRSVHPGNGEKEFQHTPFVERLLKENGMKMIFEQNILTELETVMTSARRDLMKHAAISNEMGLPLTSSNMQALLRFPPRLLQTCLQIRLQSAENLNNPAPAQVDQLLEDFRDALSVACRVKRSFIALAKPTEQWSTGVELDPEYDKTLRSCLQTYFRLLHRKLVNSGKQGSNKDFEVLESQWPFLQEIVRDIDGGQYELALRYCQQAKYHVRIWTRLLARMLKGPPTYDSMSSQDLGKWLSRALQAIRPPILKGQRLVRTIQNAVANSTDYEFDDPFPLLAQLVDTKHVLVYTSGEWESRGVYVIGSQSLLQKPHLARQLLAACIVDETLTAEEYRDCYVLVVRTDAEFSWTGTSIAPEGGEIPFQDLELSPGQMRLISPGIARLDRHRQWLERINIAAKRPSWDTATTVTDEIIGNLVKGADGRQRARRARKHESGAKSHSRAGSTKAACASRDGGSGGGDSSDEGICNDENDGAYDELDDDVGSDFEALRPSLTPFDGKLDRINVTGIPSGKDTPAAAAVAAALARASTRQAAGRQDTRMQVPELPSNGRDLQKPPAPVRIRELTRAHNPLIQKEWTLLKYGIVRMLDALTQVPDMLRTLHIDFHERRYYEKRNQHHGGGHRQSDVSPMIYDIYDAHGGHQNRHQDQHSADAAYLAVPALTCRGASCDLLELVQEAFLFVSNTASRGSRFLDLKAERYIRLALLHMCVGWCGFITEDCMANEKRTFRWAVQALEFTMRVTKHNTVQVLPPDDWQLIKSHVAGCLTLMISHFDILGARNEETKKNKQRQREKEQELRRMDDPNALLSLDGIGANFRTQLLQKQREQHAYQLDTMRDYYLAEEGKIGRMLEVTARPEDQTLRLLAASSSNITIRWQIGRYIGGGSFGSVYVGYNLDTGELMAVKEIRFPTRPIERGGGLGNANNANNANNRAADGGGAHDNPGSKIVREMEVMSMLQHPNIVTYYGIEVHREKVYLFMELCTKGSLSQVIKDQCGLDEDTAKVYVVQMLQGLKYLHESGICHRDIKCDNTLLDESMNIKLVDFGAAKVLNQQSLAATRRTRMGKDGGASLTGTPMYMAPEVILGSNSGRDSGGSGGGGAGGTGSGTAGSASGGLRGGVPGETLRPGKLGAQDIWSLGCCIVEMITGTPPWAHLDNEWAIMYHVVAGNPPLPDPSMISSEGMRFIKRCFTRQPADRPQASDLLKDEWVAGTVRKMERLKEREQMSGRLAAGSNDYMSSLDIMSAGLSDGPGLISDGDAAVGRSGSANALDVLMESPARELDQDRVHSISSVGSVGLPLNPAVRVRTPTTSRRMHTDDFRFTVSTVVSTEGSASSNGGEQSPGGSVLDGSHPGASFAHNIGITYAAGSPRSPMANTPGSPHSASSLHAAWPFNKDVPSLNASSTPGAVTFLGQNSVSIPASASQGARTPGTVLPWSQMPCGSVGALTASSSTDISRAPSITSPDALIGGAGEDLVALYSSPSNIYQALSACPSSCGAGCEQIGGGLAAPSAVSLMGQRQNDLSPLSEPAAAASPAAAAGGGNGESTLCPSMQPSANASGPTGPKLSSDEMQDLTETTRKAVSAMLNMPLEGVDVSGVAGWLGRGTTPLALLDADEVKETVATTSQIVVRQREQQIRKQQEIRQQQLLVQQRGANSNTPPSALLGQMDAAGGCSQPLLQQRSQLQREIIDGGDQQQVSSIAQSDSLPLIVTTTYPTPGFVPQRAEPPALYPLPPGDDEDSEDSEEGEEEQEDEDEDEEENDY